MRGVSAGDVTPACNRQTGKGRTACVSACALAWLGEMDSPTAALDYVCERRGSSVDAMCVPSQVRCDRYWRRGGEGPPRCAATEIGGGGRARPPATAAASPVQARYTRYFEHVLHGVKPRPGPSVLRRVIINGIPDFSKPLPPDDDDEEGDEEGGGEAEEGAAGGGAGGEDADPLRLGSVGRIADAVFDAAGESRGS